MLTVTIKFEYLVVSCFLSADGGDLIVARRLKLVHYLVLEDGVLLQEALDDVLSADLGWAREYSKWYHTTSTT